MPRLAALTARVGGVWRACRRASRDRGRSIIYVLALAWLVGSAAAGGLRAAAVCVWDALPVHARPEPGPDARKQQCGIFYNALERLQRQVPSSGQATVAMVIPRRALPGTHRRYGEWVGETTYRLYPIEPDLYYRADSGEYPRASPSSPSGLSSDGPRVWDHDLVLWCDELEEPAPRSHELVFVNPVAHVYRRVK